LFPFLFLTSAFDEESPLGFAEEVAEDELRGASDEVCPDVLALAAATEADDLDDLSAELSGVVPEAGSARWNKEKMKVNGMNK